MQITEEFATRLSQRFNDRYRVRWSDALQEFHLEERVRRGIAEGFADVNPKNVARRRAVADDLIRARDGYNLVMRLATGTTSHCPECNFEFNVPVRETLSHVCEFCQLKGRRKEMVVGFWPLDDSLIYELERIDPLNVKGGKDGIDRVSDDINAANERLERARLADFIRPVDAAARERFRRLLGIPQVGYTGREANWIQ